MKRYMAVGGATVTVGATLAVREVRVPGKTDPTKIETQLPACITIVLRSPRKAIGADNFERSVNFYRMALPGYCIYKFHDLTTRDWPQEECFSFGTNHKIENSLLFLCSLTMDQGGSSLGLTPFARCPVDNLLSMNSVRAF